MAQIIIQIIIQIKEIVLRRATNQTNFNVRNMTQ